MERQLILCIVHVLHFFKCVPFCQAAVASWMEWPGNGYVGLSNDEPDHATSRTECSSYGGDLLVYEDTAEMNDLLITLSSDSYSAWTSGGEETGSCNYILVVSSDVYDSTTSCDSSKYFLCHLPRVSVTSMVTPVQTESPTTIQTESPTTDSPTAPSMTTLAETESPTTVHTESATDVYTETTTANSATEDHETSTQTAAVSEKMASERRTTLETRTTTNDRTPQTDHVPTERTTTSLPAHATPEYITVIDPAQSFAGLEWNVWIPWTECTTSCGTGTRFRLKLCADDGSYSERCNYTLGKLDNITISYATEWDLTCNSQPCPVWTLWTKWTDCSATCGLGTRIRQRRCLGEDLLMDGCVGQPYEVDYCDLSDCPAYVVQEPVEESSFKESDSRPSAIGLGSMSLIFVLIEVVMIVIIDLFTITAQCRYLKRNLQHLRPR